MKTRHAGSGLFVPMVFAMVAAGILGRHSDAVGQRKEVPTTQSRLSAEAEKFLLKRLAVRMKAKISKSDRVEKFIKSGIAKNNDAVERYFKYKSERLVHSHVALAAKVGDDKVRHGVKVDPIVRETSRGAARSRLGREPTETEVGAEVDNYDKRIAKLNKALAAERKAIATAYKKTGEFPRDLERRILGVKDVSPNPDDPAVKNGMTKLLIRMVEEAAKPRRARD